MCRFRIRVDFSVDLRAEIESAQVDVGGVVEVLPLEYGESEKPEE